MLLRAFDPYHGRAVCDGGLAMKESHKQKQRLEELRKARDAAEKAFNRWKENNPDETNPVYRQLFNRMVRTREAFFVAYNASV